MVFEIQLQTIRMTMHLVGIVPQLKFAKLHLLRLDVSFKFKTWKLYGFRTRVLKKNYCITVGSLNHWTYCVCFELNVSTNTVNYQMPTEVFNHTVDQHLNDSMNTQNKTNKQTKTPPTPTHTHTRPPSSDKQTNIQKHTINRQHIQSEMEF